jgi:hypothetical protein
MIADRVIRGEIEKRSYGRRGEIVAIIREIVNDFTRRPIGA